MSIVGGYLKWWFVSMGSVIGMLFVCMIVAEIADANVVTLFVLAFDASVLLFIILTMIPVAIFILGFWLLYTAFAPIMVPFSQSIVDLLFPTFAGLFVEIGVLKEVPATTPMLPGTINILEAAMAFKEFISAFTDNLLSNSGVLDSGAERVIDDAIG